MKDKRKKQIYLTLISIAVIIGVSFFLFPGLFSNISLGFAEPQQCTDSPFFKDCTCSESFQKVGSFPAKCVKLTQIPEQVNLPIDTWEEARKFAEQQISPNVKCADGFFWTYDLTGNIQKNQFGTYGSPVYDRLDNLVGYILTMECQNVQETYENGQPKSGTFAWTIYFDPIDGFVYQKACNPNVISECTEQISFRMKEAVINPICNDNKCSPGEDFNICADDCPVTNCGDGLCQLTESANSCPVDCKLPLLSSTCGNSKCEFSESPLSCPTDCSTPSQIVNTCESETGASCTEKVTNCGGYISPKSYINYKFKLANSCELVGVRYSLGNTDSLDNPHLIHLKLNDALVAKDIINPTDNGAHQTNLESPVLLSVDTFYTLNIASQSDYGVREWMCVFGKSNEIGDWETFTDSRIWKNDGRDGARYAYIDLLCK